ncbi:glycoside hydrolase family 10 protein [Paenibacillus ginsengarvi]|uniref:Glycosyl hydrolase-like 10 domain-containing protein n=1 Tax=Paenibacillus ginsengarvi TaxID=400777 RepID=A0A3B0ANR2_9BACL|nr:family 10 glycosylhydrolase [Paenibacillus ginsengarvi]RKN62785.1 hypothetical protein D7M11_34835 [Paenibacillus ginsengarvi]
MKKLLLVAILLFTFGSNTIVFAETAQTPNLSLLLENGTVLPIGYIDRGRLPDQIGIFTFRYGGESTRPFGAGTVEWIVSGDVIVEKNTDGTAGTRIPSGSFVLSASGTALPGLMEAQVGQIVKVVNGTIELRPEQYADVNGTLITIDKRNATRNTGEVILFDPSFGPSTKQNAYGMEITVVNGVATRVVALTADPNIRNDSPIPSDGYVVSIQTRSPYYTLLNGKVKVGDPVSIVLDPLRYRAVKLGYDGYNVGFRGTDSLIVYDRAFGEKTGTNPYGNEIIVNADGIAVSSGGNNRPIPANGYVLSGVGVKGTWLKDNVPVGSKIRIDPVNKQIIVISTPQAVFDKASYLSSKLRESLQQSRSEFRDVPYEQIEQQLTVAETVYGQVYSMRGSAPAAVLAIGLKQLDQAITDATFLHEESRVMETRGIWVRPKETTREQVEQRMSKIKAAHFNTVYLETWWNGQTIYPTSVADASQNPIYAGFDALQAYIDEGKRLGIEVHAWVENFRAGDGTPSVALTRHPDWGIMSRQGQAYEVADNVKKYYLNPALPEVRNYLSSIYREILTHYDVDGLHLDFTRYPQSKDYSNDFGYDPYTRELFRTAHGADPLALHPGDALWEEWLRFRTDLINSWVDRVAEEARSAKPDLILSAAVWPNYDTAPALFAQETKTWTGKNEIDQIVHMSYVRDASLLVGDMRKSLDIAGGKAFVASGVGAYMYVQDTLIAEQVREVNRAGGAGTAMFEYEATFGGGYDRVLSLGVYRNEAVRPDYRHTKPLTLWLKDMVRKIDEIYVPLQGMSAHDATRYKIQLNIMVKLLEAKETYNPLLAKAVKLQMDVMQGLLSHDPSIQAEVLKRMTTDLEYGLQTLKMVDVKNIR